MAMRLDEPDVYVEQIAALAHRRRRDAWLATVELTAPLVAAHAEQVAPRLAYEVCSGRYSFQPLVPRTATLNGKVRTIYGIDPLDAVVLGAVTRVVMSQIEPQLGTHLFSYRAGKSQWTASAAFVRFLRAHARKRKDPKQRGLFVLRRDVRRYDERIPVGDDSRLWSVLAQLCAGRELGMHSDLDALFKRAFRPPIAWPDGSVRPLDVGVATGLPTQTIACNVYLLPVDQRLLEIEGGFYARFGDDILFAHPEQAAAQEAARRLDVGTQELKLEFNDSKSQAFWLTRSGSAQQAEASFKPATHVSYLGLDVGFDGVRLRADKRRKMWRALRRRLDHTENILAGGTTEERVDALCSCIRTAFDPKSFLAERYAPWLRFAFMSREDLVQLDHHIALEVAQRVSKRRGVRAFREYPPKRLREKHGLPSLLELWDAARRGRAEP